jgi:hypothetical protein
MRAIALTVVCISAVLSFVSLSPRAASASSFATEVVSYSPGSNVPAGYDNPAAALGSPGRSTGSGPFDGDVTPFNAPYQASDVVTVGAGGSLVVKFDHPVVDDAANPYGIDLLVFGNAFLGIDFDNGLADGTIFAEPGHIAVSQDGVTWFNTSVTADGLYPTFAYQDPTGPFSSGGTIPTSYTRPVNPALGLADFAGKSTAELAALYAGSGGGAGIDLAPLGLPWIQYVRVFQDASDGFATDIDAFADAPEPSLAALLAAAFLGLTCSRARTRRPNRRPAECARAR